MKRSQPAGHPWRELLPLTRTLYYHPAMKGSWSFKAVLPTIAPDVDYANIDGGVKSGGDVEPVYSETLDPATDAGSQTALETTLGTYCERDTLALCGSPGLLRGRERSNAR